MKVRRWIGMVAFAAVAAGLPLLFPGVFRAVARTLSREAVAPLERFTIWAGDRLASWRVCWRAVAVDSENATLRRQVRELETQLTVARTVERENSRLRRQLGFSRSLPGLIPAEVLSSGGADGWSQRVRIGKGWRHGVRSHAPVLSAQGLVGLVIEVTATTADVLLIIDVNSRVACMFDPDIPSARGILMGGGRTLAGAARVELLHTIEPLRLTYLEKDVVVPEQARVITSGLGGVYPQGLAVGIVIRSVPDPGGLFQRSDVVPFVDFAGLRHVAVLVDGSQARQGRDGP